MPFVPTFEPFKPDKVPTFRTRANSSCFGLSDGEYHEEPKYPYEFGGESFRWPREAEWAETFTHLGLKWEYEPLIFDMGQNHLHYLPDFHVKGLRVSNSDRPLYVEVRTFPGSINYAKCIDFTDWYGCDVLILANNRGGVLHPKWKCLLVYECPLHKTYFDSHCWGSPPADYQLPEMYEHASCWASFKRADVKQRWLAQLRNYFLIQRGSLVEATVGFPEELHSPKGRKDHSDPRPDIQILVNSSA